MCCDNSKKGSKWKILFLIRWKLKHNTINKYDKQFGPIQFRLFLAFLLKQWPVLCRASSLSNTMTSPTCRATSQSTITSTQCRAPSHSTMTSKMCSVTLHSPMTINDYCVFIRILFIFSLLCPCIVWNEKIKLSIETILNKETTPI